MCDKGVLNQAPDDDDECNGGDKPVGGTGGMDDSEAGGELQGTGVQPPGPERGPEQVLRGKWFSREGTGSERPCVPRCRAPGTCQTRSSAPVPRSSPPYSVGSNGLASSWGKSTWQSPDES
ncbi:hypothetical protein PAL_GLEAN10006793 [Pteropus alecto]|uniref:Uncharacterized protein n=1 Tax=Pteropus alecto TaxID=9402 RepID=L5L4R1_PTEAL|nr:hypothetical protein PAL_GLEAN10006793 [Pteropus alecto]